MITYNNKKSAEEIALQMKSNLSDKLKQKRASLISSALVKVSKAAEIFDELGYSSLSEKLTSQLEKLEK